MNQDRYHPRRIEEIDGNGVSLINELPPADVAVLVQSKPRPLHAVLVESLNSVQALIGRLERGVSAPAYGCQAIRDLYVAARQQRDALAAALQVDGLE